MNKIEEFWYCVAPQDDLPLYKEQEIHSKSCENLINLIQLYRSRAGSAKPEDVIQSILLEQPRIISDIRVLVGVSDKRLYLDLTYLANRYADSEGNRLVPERREHLLKHNTSYFIRQLSRSPMRAALAEQMTRYFLSKGLMELLDTFLSLDTDQIIPIFNNLIAPKEIQQMQAKYRGHGAEQAFARIITACGLSITPSGKDVDPMAGYDPNVDLSAMKIVARDAGNEDCHSFDLVVRDKNSRIRVLIQSLIHSSDPGQFGVNKSDETVDISKRIRAYNRTQSKQNRVYLLGSVDGVGFSENPNGTIIKMLDAFDDFFQIHTLFKIPVFLQKIGMIDHVKGVLFDPSYFDDYAIDHFVTAYLVPAGVENLTGQRVDKSKMIQAGKAAVVFK